MDQNLRLYNLSKMMPLIKCFTSLGAIFILILGLALLGLTVYLFFNNSIFLGNTTTEYTVLGIAFGLSISVIATAGEGIYGICKRKPKMVCAFQIIIIILMAVFFALAISLFFLPDIFFNGGCQNPSNPVITYATQIYNVSQQSFCRPSCPCGLNNTTTSYSTTYNQSEQDYITNNFALDPNGPNDTVNCINGNLTDNQKSILTAVGKLQQFLSCSLWCADNTQYNLIYRFSNVNDGKPQYFCYNRLEDLYIQYSDIGKYTLFGSGGVMTLMFICNMYICCCASDRKGKSKRDRFMYYVDQREEQDRYNRYNNEGRDRNRDYRRYDDRRRN